jgi:hypothetical protein
MDHAIFLLHILTNKQTLPFSPSRAFSRREGVTKFIDLESSHVRHLHMTDPGRGSRERVAEQLLDEADL